MEKVIKLLVEYDKEGQEIVQRAQEQRRDVLEHMDDFKRALATEYGERADNRIAIVQQQALTEREEALAEARRQNTELMESLRKNFQANSEQWIEQIVQRCIGG